MAALPPPTSLLAAASSTVDIPAVRAKLDRAEKAGSKLGRVWQAIRRQTFAAPDKYNWWTPFVALVTDDAKLHQIAKQQIFAYLRKLEDESLYMGVQFHFWCYSFPHARWAIWYDLLRASGHWTPDEILDASSRFILLQARDFHAGLLTKPYPECVDNQAASLCLSSLVVGTLLGDTPGASHVTKALLKEANHRAEAMIGGMPRSGYSGEGSTYQGLIVAFTVPFFVEFLERSRGGDWFNRPLKPQGTSPHDILQMTARSWMPSGLLLPWDDYGYQFGGKAGIAYLAHRTKDPRYTHVLEHAANWSYDIGAGWGFDDNIWALIYWPEIAQPANAKPQSPLPWAHEELGGVLVSPAGDRYLMQMWDPPSDIPLRADVNPNSIVLEADGSPLTTDGSPTSACKVFHYSDTLLSRRGINFNSTEFSFGSGCGGAHNVLLVDGWEGLRPKSPYPPQKLAGFVSETQRQQIVGDVTGLYASVYPDAQSIRRRSTLVDNTFWLIEDHALFAKDHKITSRWYFRPQVESLEKGIKLTTAEGVNLHMIPLVGDNTHTITRIDGYPANLEAMSDRVDFQTQGSDVRWLWLLWPQATRKQLSVLDRWWEARPAPADADPEAVFSKDDLPTFDVAPSAPPWTLIDAPMSDTWWYRTHVTPHIPTGGTWWLELPRCIRRGTRLWINRKEVDLTSGDTSIWPRADLMPSHVPAPANLPPGKPIEITLLTHFFSGYRDSKGSHDPMLIDTAPRLLTSRPDPEWIEEAGFEDDLLTVTSTLGRSWKIPYHLM